MPQPLPCLHYLDFDTSEDTQHQVCWDALASVQPERWPALLHELEQLLRWCHAQAAPLPLDEGGLWDFDLHAQQDATGQPLPLHWQDDQLHSPPLPPEAGWLSLSLTLSGQPSFAQAFQAAWQTAPPD